MTRSFALSALFTFPTLVTFWLGTTPAWAQTEGLDEFDAGDQWVDTDEDVDWYSTTGQLMWEDPGAFTLDLTGGHRTAFRDTEVFGPADDRLGGRYSKGEFYALATLQIPWEGLGLIARRTQRRQIAQATGSGSSSAPREPDEGSTSGREQTQSAPAAQGGDETDQRTESTLESTPAELEPPIGAVTEDEPPAALSPDLVLLVSRQIAAHVGSAEQAVDQRLRSLVRRSRYSGLSPELRMRGVLGFDRTTSTKDSVGIYPGDTTTRGARDSLAEVRLTFRLDRLVLGDKEDSIERQRIQLVTGRRKMVADAINLFMQWRLASARSADESLPPEDRLRAQVQAETNLAQLHVVTGGWFQGEKTLRELAADLPGAAHGG